MFPICLKYLVRNSKRNFRAYLKVTDLKPMNSKQTSKMNKAIPSIFFPSSKQKRTDQNAKSQSTELFEREGKNIKLSEARKKKQQG